MTKTPTYNYAHIKSDQFAKTKPLPLSNAIEEKLEQFYANVSNNGYVLGVGLHDPEGSPAVLLTSPKNMPELNFEAYSRDKFLANMGTVTVEGGKKLPSFLKSPSVPLAVFKDAEVRNIDVKAGCTVVTDSSTAIDTTFKGNNILAGDTHVEGGTLEYLSAAGNVTIKTTGELKHCTFAGNVTIDGNVTLTGIDLHGDVHFSTNPGSDSITIRHKDGRSAHAVYDLNHLKARDKGFNYSITGLYLSVSLQALKEHPGVLDATLCMSHSVHSQHMNSCRCALYYPLLFERNSLALAYFLRAAEHTKQHVPTIFESIPNSQIEDALDKVVLAHEGGGVWYGTLKGSDIEPTAFVRKFSTPRFMAFLKSVGITDASVLWRTPEAG